MRAASAAALARVQERWEPVLRGAGEQARAWGEQLFGVVDLLDSSVSLSRALTDPAREPGERAGLAAAVLAGKTDEAVADLVGGLARERWSAVTDLADAAESLAVTSLLAAAEQAGRLEEVEDEVYRLERIVSGERELGLALTARDRTAADRGRLMRELLAGKAAPESEAIAVRAASTPRGRPLPAVLRGAAEAAAARRERLVAAVTSAAPLTEQQVSRLAGVLSRRHGREVQVHVSLDPAVVGGLRIEVGEQVVDATLASRLADARRRLAG